MLHFIFFWREGIDVRSNRWCRMCALRKEKTKYLCLIAPPFYQTGSGWGELIHVRGFTLTWDSHMFSNVLSFYESEKESKWYATKPYHLSNLKCLRWMKFFLYVLKKYYWTFFFLYFYLGVKLIPCFLFVFSYFFCVLPNKIFVRCCKQQDNFAFSKL